MSDHIKSGLYASEDGREVVHVWRFDFSYWSVVRVMPKYQWLRLHEESEIARRWPLHVIGCEVQDD